MSEPRRGAPIVIVTPRWKVSQLCDIVRGDVERGWLTPEQGRRIIRDGKARMVYKPPAECAPRSRRGRSGRSR